MSWTLRWRLLLALCLGGLPPLLLGLLLLLSYQQLRQQALAAGLAELELRHALVLEGLDQVFLDAQARSRELARQVLTAGISGDQVVRLLEAQVLHDPDTASTGVMTELDNPLLPGRRWGVAVTYTSQGLVHADLATPTYDYWTRGWYAQTLASVDGFWAAPYFNDAAGGQDTITFDQPMRTPEGRNVGMVSVSLTLDRVAEAAWRLGLRDDRFDHFLLCDASGRVLLSSQPRLERAYTLAQVRQRRASDLSWLPLAAVDSDGSGRSSAEGGGYWAAGQMPSTGWRLYSARSDRSLLAPLHASVKQMLWVAGLLALALLPLGWWLSRRLAQPWRGLAEWSDRLLRGGLQPALAAPGGGGLLDRVSAGLACAEQAIEHSRRLQAALQAEQQQAQQQRQLGEQLQQALLPADRVLFGSQLECEVSGLLRPAEPLSGAFYGVLAPAPGVCSFYLGEAQPGHRSPLWVMSRLGHQLPVLLRDDSQPQRCLQRLGELLLDEDVGDCPRALLIGRLDLSSGQLDLATDGQPAPLRIDAQGRQHRLAMSSPGRGYSGVLQAGDRLLLVSRQALAEQPGAGDPQLRLQVAVERLRERSGRELLQELADALQPPQPAADSALLLLSLRHRD